MNFGNDIGATGANIIIFLVSKHQILILYISVLICFLQDVYIKCLKIGNWKMFGETQDFII